MMQLANNHIFYTSCNDIAEIAKPLRQLGITYFTYGRTYNDGSRLTLQDGHHVLEIYYKKKYYLTGNTECKPENYKEQTILWSTLPNQKVFDDCARSADIDHGIFMFQPQDNYLEVFGFATHKENDRIINTYLSKMDILTKFKEYFREKASPIIKQADKQKFVLPFNNKLNISRSFLNINDNLLLNVMINKILTPRQIECCQLLLNGYTAKEIAIQLNLSIRTVEYYFGNIRTKLQCNNKAELIAKLTLLLKST